MWGVSCCYKNILWFFTNFKYLQVILTCYKSPTNFYHIMLYQVHLAWVAFKLTTFVVIGTDCTGSYKSNKHKIMTTTAPQHNTTLQITYDFEPATTLLELSPLNFFFYLNPQIISHMILLLIITVYSSSLILILMILTVLELCSLNMLKIPKFWTKIIWKILFAILVWYYFFW